MKNTKSLTPTNRVAANCNSVSFTLHTFINYNLKHIILSFTIFALFLLTSCSTLSSNKNNTGASYPDAAQTSESDQHTSDNQSASTPDEQAPENDSALNTGAKQSSEIPEDVTGETVPEEPILAKNGQGVMDEALVFCQLAQELWQKGELENALESLDKAYSLILGIDETDDSKLTQQKEDLRYLISKRILEIYASRNIVVNGNHNAIPLTMNRHVEEELERLTRGGEQSFFLQSYRRSGKYHSYIVSALKAEGLPEELAWIPLIESGFKVKALSKARALGLWQFIPSTGYKFGLKRNQFIDERIDPYKATHAAVAYLKELHQIFGDWTTVLAAYNCGEGRVLRVIRTQNVNYLDNFWDLYEKLPRETARYVPKFLATLHILNNPEKYGLNDIEPNKSLEFDTVEINRQTHLKDLTQLTGASLETLKDLNPELRHDILPPEKYILRVPIGKTEELLAKINSVPITNPPRRAYARHRVRRGETLSTIARKYRTSVSSIKRANNIRRSNLIVAGKMLKIPQKGYVVATSAGSDKSRRVGGTHKVRRGDSLWIIAKRYDTTTKKIMELNRLRTTHLRIGQTINIPGEEQDTISPEKLSVYYVKRGDSPYSIARRHQMPLENLLRINNLTPRSKIYPGQKLQVQ